MREKEKKGNGKGWQERWKEREWQGNEKQIERETGKDKEKKERGNKRLYERGKWKGNNWNDQWIPKAI